MPPEPASPDPPPKDDGPQLMAALMAALSNLGFAFGAHGAGISKPDRPHLITQCTTIRDAWTKFDASVTALGAALGLPVSQHQAGDVDRPDPLIDPDCRDGKHGSCIGGPCECDHHKQPA